MRRVKFLGVPVSFGLFALLFLSNLANAQSTNSDRLKPANNSVNDLNLKIEQVPTAFKSLKLKVGSDSSPLFFNDPYYEKQKFLQNIRAEAAYRILYAVPPTSRARIGIIDQGRADGSNAELVGQLVTGSDVSSGSVNHGQFVLGIMAASSNNGYGMVGVAGAHAEFLYRSLPIVDRKPNANQIAQYVREFGRLGFDAVNLSFAIEQECSRRSPEDKCYHAIVASPVIRNAIIETARNYKTVFVVSAGNSSQPLPVYATPENGVLVVGAASKSGSISSYSNYGAGVNLYVTEDGIYGLSKNSVASPQNGTSFTTPVVTAAVGQVHRYLKNNGIQLSAGELARLVVSTSQNEADLLKNNSSGKHLDFGRLAEEAQRIVQSRR